MLDSFLLGTVYLLLKSSWVKLRSLLFLLRQRAFSYFKVKCLGLKFVLNGFGSYCHRHIKVVELGEIRDHCRRDFFSLRLADVHLHNMQGRLI